MRGIRALVLDVDDTIVDTRGAMVEAGTIAAAALWPERGDLHVAWAQRYYDDPARWFRRYAAGEASYETMRAARLAEAAEAFDLDLPPTAGHLYEEAYAPAFRSAQRLFPDVLGLLDAADARGLPMALLTNSSQEPTLMKLEVLGITDRFVAVITTDTVGVGKPDPRVYAAACQQAGAAPEESVCIGDSLEWDVHGASAAGLRSVWLDRAGVGDGGAVVSIRDLTAVTAVLASRADDLGE